MRPRWNPGCPLFILFIWFREIFFPLFFSSSSSPPPPLFCRPRDAVFCGHREGHPRGSLRSQATRRRPGGKGIGGTHFNGRKLISRLGGWGAAKCAAWSVGLWGKAKSPYLSVVKISRPSAEKKQSKLYDLQPRIKTSAFGREKPKQSKKKNRPAAETKKKVTGHFRAIPCGFPP